MLWWFIGVWLASGAVIPVLWLFSVAYRGVFFRDIEAKQGQEVVESHSTAAAASTLTHPLISVGHKRIGRP
jgi:hypothetical protein